MIRRIIRTDDDRRRAQNDIARLPIERGIAFDLSVDERRPMVTSEQIQCVMALCGDLARQVDLPGGGRTDKEGWYRFLLALMRGETMVRDGDVVVILGSGGLSKATRSEASDLIEFISAWGASKGVRFSAPKWRETA